eukprot:1136641-Pelagomonas_calceolata.AAC.2
MPAGPVDRGLCELMPAGPADRGLCDLMPAGPVHAAFCALKRSFQRYLSVPAGGDQAWHGFVPLNKPCLLACGHNKQGPTLDTLHGLTNG